MSEILRTLPDGGDWCSIEKAEALACLIVALRPRRIVEIGVWRGGSLVPMAMAMRYAHGGGIGRTGTAEIAWSSPTRPLVVAIDAWDPAASVAGEEPKNAEWWGGAVGASGHEESYRIFTARLEREGLAGIVEIVRAPSDDVVPPAAIGLLHVDGNHTDQAIRDVERFAPQIERGGVLALDDIDWSSGSVARAHELARSLGFRDLYQVDKTVVMVRG